MKRKTINVPVPGGTAEYLAALSEQGFMGTTPEEVAGFLIMEGVARLIQTEMLGKMKATLENI